jgi:hypothetical protein
LLKKKTGNDIDNKVNTKTRKASTMADSAATYVTAQETKTVQAESCELGKMPRRKQKISENAENYIIIIIIIVVTCKRRWNHSAVHCISPLP